MLINTCGFTWLSQKRVFWTLHLRGRHQRAVILWLQILSVVNFNAILSVHHLLQFSVWAGHFGDTVWIVREQRQRITSTPKWFFWSTGKTLLRFFLLFYFMQFFFSSLSLELLLLHLPLSSLLLLSSRLDVINRLSW